MQQNDINHRPPRRWTKIILEVAEPLAELSVSFIGDLSGSGVEYNNCYHPGTENNISSITAYLEEDQKCSEKIDALELFLENLHKQNPQHARPKFTTDLLIEEDWGNSWKKHFKPIHATNRIVIKPSWEESPPNKGEFVLEIDPGMAFGTGMHASTQLSLEFIDELFQNHASKLSTTLDVGTGTGILGLGAALLGCPHVVGIDNDIDARIAAVENIKKNALEEKMSVVDQDLGNITGKFDLVIANIIHNTLIELAKPLTEKIAANGFLILAGILSGKQAENIIRTYSAIGLNLVEEKQKEEWSAICLSKR